MKFWKVLHKLLATEYDVITVNLWMGGRTVRTDFLSKKEVERRILKCRHYVPGIRELRIATKE